MPRRKAKKPNGGKMTNKKLESMRKAELIRRVEALEPKQAKPEANPSKTIEIRNRFTNEIIYESKTATLKEAVEEAVRNKHSIWGADLTGADLSEADLSGADLSGADLSEADLSGADLTGADLCYCKMDKKVFKQITEEWFKWEVE